MKIIDNKDAKLFSEALGLPDDFITKKQNFVGITVLTSRTKTEEILNVLKYSNSIEEFIFIYAAIRNLKAKFETDSEDAITKAIKKLIKDNS
ncbi:MAG: hypothetical protein ACLFVR_14720 [Thiohalospira sp.]